MPCLNFFKRILNGVRVYSGLAELSIMADSVGSLKRNYYRRPLPDKCISFSSSEGKKIFKESLLAGHLECYYKLASQFRTQDEPAFCGLSTLVMILNALEIDPGQIWKGPWRWYHENMLDCCAPLEIVEQNGINFYQFVCIASCNNLNVISTRVDDKVDISSFREIVKGYTKQDESFLVASYSRAVLGQTGEGHFSPIGGYHPALDMVLVLDTARFKYPPHWIPLSLFFEAMKAIDKETGKPRGYMVLSKEKERGPLLLFSVSDILSVTSPTILPDDVTNFIQSLKSSFSLPTTKINESAEDVLLDTVLNHFITAADFLQEGHFLITLLKVDPEHLNLVNSMVKDIESLQIYCYLCQTISPLNRELLSKLFLFPSKFEEYGTFANRKLEYMLTILMLCWPYSCSICTSCSSCLAHEMIKYVNHVLTSNVELLKDEVMTLNAQLDTIINFNECRNKPKKCCKKTCKTPKKV